MFSTLSIIDYNLSIELDREILKFFDVTIKIISNARI